MFSQRNARLSHHYKHRSGNPKPIRYPRIYHPPSRIQGRPMADETPSQFRYWAFISYSSKDRKFGEWLIKSLESYRTPRPFVGRPTTRGEPVPTRPYPVFRDRDELPTDADLGGAIRRALQESRYLIVICSPNSAASRWVNEEILTFKRLGRENRILSLIIDGSPNASIDPAKDPKSECYPEALRFALGADGNLSAERTHPISADARERGDAAGALRLQRLSDAPRQHGHADIEQRVDEIHAERDEADAGDLPCRRPAAERDDPDEQHEDGRGAAGDRVDDRELRRPIGGDQQREVEKL